MADLIHALNQVNTLAALPTGWNYGRGCAPSISTCARARSVLSALYGLGLRKFNIAPSSEAGITVAGIFSRGNDLEIHCGDEKPFQLYVTEAGQDKIDLDGLSFTQLLEELRGISWLSLKSSTWFTPNFICLTWNDSQVNHLKIPQTVQGCRSFALNAPSKNLEAYARTYRHTLAQTYAVNRPSFGDLTTQDLQTA